MKWTKVIALLVLVNVAFTGKSQNLKDSSLFIPMTGLHLSGQLAAGDLQKRYGNTMSVGIPFMIKTKSNWIFGIEGSYFFWKKSERKFTFFITNRGGIDNSQ